MSTRYDPNHKAAVMVMLERNRGDVHATARQTGVPVNTLRDWQHDVFPYLSSSDTPSARQVAEIPVFESDLDALAFIRQNILGELSRLSASLKDDPGFSTPYQRVLVMSQLMDKLLKLDWHMKPYSHDPYRRDDVDSLFGPFLGRGDYQGKDDEVYDTGECIAYEKDDSVTEDDDEDGYNANWPA